MSSNPAAHTVLEHDKQDETGSKMLYGLREEMARVAECLGYNPPKPLTPEVIWKRDVMCVAESGSGKLQHSLCCFSIISRVSLMIDAIVLLSSLCRHENGQGKWVTWLMK